MKDNIKLVAVDIDGTFVRSDYTYDILRFKQILSRMRNVGCNFVVASGNPYLKLQQCFPEIQKELTYIAENGGYIMDQGEELFSAHLLPQDSQLIIDTLLLIHLKQCLMCYAGLVQKSNLIL